MSHILKIRIYYEDTDCGGVVYYANYLRYAERARTEFFEARGLSLRKLMDDGVYFVVAEAALKYLSPGRYGDMLAIKTTVERVGPASIVFGHVISRDNTGEKLVEATVKLGYVGQDMKPLRLGQNILDVVTKGDEIS